MGEAPSPAGEPRGASRLAGAASAYLRGARDQPIDWFPWGPDAFETARRTGRPILLDIGAVWCHWCHVMDEGTYSDPEVARLLLQHFVAVKVDRDEHPEIDRRYQRQVSALTGQGGWPLTAFLTPDGEVFLGGTYFPPQDALGRPGFRRVLKEVARIWRDEPAKARGSAASLRTALDRLEGGSGPVPAPAAFVERVRENLRERYDVVHGGFGLAPKFPHPTAIAFLLWAGFAHGDAVAAARARETLQRMADGGIYDHLGGGFHRYSVDEGWHIPHFEKMGADNAALLAAYVDGARRFGDATFEATVRGTLGWITEVLGDPAGGFGSSQDADNAPGDDGSYFTWSRAEVRAALEPEEARLVTRAFGLGTDGRMPHDPERNVLYRLLPAAEAAEGLPFPAAEAADRLEVALGKLRRVRAQRPTPYVDRALYAHLNGAFARGIVASGQLLDDERYARIAARALDRFLGPGYAPERGVAHHLGPDGPSGFGHLEDQAEFAWALLELAGARADARYLARAEEILALIDREFRGDDGRLRDLAPRLYDGPRVGAIAEPSYPLEDNPHLAANAAVALAHLRHAALTGRDDGRVRARRLVASLTPHLEGAGLFAAGTALAAGLLDTEAARVVVDGSGPAADALLRAARRAWHPNLWVFRGLPPAPFSLPEEIASHAGGAEPRALVCFGTRCLPPITDPAQIAGLLATGGRG